MQNELESSAAESFVGVAHRHQLKVHAHVYAEQDVRHALEAGVDVLQHVGSAGTAPPYSPELIRDIVNAGRPVVVLPRGDTMPRRMPDAQAVTLPSPLTDASRPAPGSLSMRHLPPAS